MYFSQEYQGKGEGTKDSVVGCSSILIVIFLLKTWKFYFCPATHLQERCREMALMHLNFFFFFLLKKIKQNQPGQKHYLWNIFSVFISLSFSFAKKKYNFKNRKEKKLHRFFFFLNLIFPAYFPVNNSQYLWCFCCWSIQNQKTYLFLLEHQQNHNLALRIEIWSYFPCHPTTHYNNRQAQVIQKSVAFQNLKLL